MNPVTRLVRDRLAAQSNADNAVAMAAYLKTQQPFFGVKRPGLRLIEREAAKAFQPVDRATYEAWVAELWAQPERECQYLALSLARRWKRFVSVSASLAQAVPAAPGGTQCRNPATNSAK